MTSSSAFFIFYRFLLIYSGGCHGYGFLSIVVSVHACAYVKASNNQSTLTLVAYIMAGVCGLCVVPVFVSLIQWQVTKWRQCNKSGPQQPPSTADVSGLLNYDVSSIITA